MAFKENRIGMKNDRRSGLSPIDPSFERFLNSVQKGKKLPHMRNEEALRLLDEYSKTKDRTCLNKILEGNLKMLSEIALRFQNSTVTTSDLFQEACLGFLEGLVRYNDAKAATNKGKTKVANYAYFWAKKWITMYLEKSWAPVKLPSRPIRAAMKYAKLLEQYEKEFEVDGKYIPLDYIVTDVQPATVAGAQIALSGKGTLSVTDTDRYEEGSGEITPGDKWEAADDAEEHLDFDRLHSALDTLDVRERALVESRFGFSTAKFKDACEDLGIRVAEGNEILAAALEKIKSILEQAKHL